MENNNVDITEKSDVTCVEWFHGYGGNAFGLHRAIPGLRSIAVCERDAFVVANMVSKMEKGLLDAAPIWTDVTDFPTEPFGRGILDLFVASYPCQGFSHAGKRLGVDDHRHLWPYCRKFIGAVRPRFVWLENVEGHVSIGLSTVLADLAEDGYEAAWGIFSAAEVGAPHQRKRVFILAYDKRSAGQQRCEFDLFGRRAGEAEQVGVDGSKGELALRNGVGLPHSEPKEQPAEAGVNAQRDAAAGGGEDVAYLVNEGLQGSERAGAHGERWTGAHGATAKCGAIWPSRPGERQYAWEPPRVVHGDYDRIANSNRRFSVEEARLRAESIDQSVGNSQSAVRQRITHGEPGQSTQPNENGVVENPVQQRVQRGASVTGGNDRGGQDGETALSGGRGEDRGANEREAQPPMGRNADGPAAGLDFPRCTGLSDTELEEIYGWMVKGTNRTDELRMCGNGVVPQTAERAFRVLHAELTGLGIGE